MINQAKFITFEGGEGGGKSTQSALLKQSFILNNKNVVHTREPGGTKGAEEIRKLLVSGDINKWDAITETLLHLAARQDHIRKLIYPELKSGNFVICDRFSDSTISYQGFGHKLGHNKVAELQKYVIEDFKPDITFILDIDIKDGISRTHKREDNENRYEKMGTEFHKRVRDGFLSIAESEPKRCFLINANDTIRNIHQQIISILNEKLLLNLPEIDI